MFKKIVSSDERTSIVYVYGENVAQKQEHFEILQIIQDILRKNPKTDIVTINHDKNDLDGYYNDSLPFLFVATRLGTIEHFDEEIQVDKLVIFLASHVPYLDLVDPTLDFVDGEL